jgi:outer membrane immunogenic protein
MNKVLGGLALSVFLTGPVVAADLPVKAAPAPIVTLYSWTGCYLGGHVGVAFGRKHVNDLTVAPGFDLHHDIDGFGVGGQLGCNVWQSDRFVLGIEGQATWVDLDGESSRLGSTQFRVSGFRTDANLIGSVAGRLGYAAGSNGQVMFFVKGGAAFIDEKFRASFNGAPFSGTSDNDLRWGWMIGGGAEAVITGNWTWKAEYNFSDFGSRNVTICANPGLCDTFSVKQTVQVFKMGINYRFFGWGGAPVVARY